MANLTHKRVSTDQQPTDRQDLVLDEAGIECPVAFEEQAGVSNRLHGADDFFGGDGGDGAGAGRRVHEHGGSRGAIRTAVSSWSPPSGPHSVIGSLDRSPVFGNASPAARAVSHPVHRAAEPARLS
ncbi:hypothetical protein ACWDWU_33280 [Streptomyces sp. NPDC003442]